MSVAINSEDIAGVWRPLSAAEALLVPGLSTQAWIRLTVPRPSLPEDIEAGTVKQESVASAMISMVVRVLKNPDSVRQLAKSYDDWSRSLTLDSSVSTGELYVNEHELALVTPAPAVLDAGAYSVGFWG